MLALEICDHLAQRVRHGDIDQDERRIDADVGPCRIEFSRIPGRACARLDGDLNVIPHKWGLIGGKANYGANREGC